MLRYEPIHLEHLKAYTVNHLPANSHADLNALNYPSSDSYAAEHLEANTPSASRKAFSKLASALYDYIADTAYVALWLAPKTLFTASWPLTAVMLGLSAVEGFTAWAVSWSGTRLVDVFNDQGSAESVKEIATVAGLLAVGAIVLQSCIKNQLENINSQLGIKTRARFSDDLASGVLNTSELDYQPKHRKLVDSSESQSWVPVGLPRILSDLIGSTSVFSVMTLSIALQAPPSLRMIVLCMVAPKAVALAINTSRYAKDMLANQAENAAMRETKPPLFTVDKASSLKRANLYKNLLGVFVAARNRVDRAESGRYNQMALFNLTGDLVLGAGLWMTFQELFLSAPRPLGEKLFLFGVVCQVYKAAVSILDRVGGIKRGGVLLRMWSDFNGVVRVPEPLSLKGQPIGFTLRGVVLRGIKTGKKLSNIPDCEIASGSVVFIIGDPDSGKSTMLQLLLGDTRAMEKGSIDVTISGRSMSVKGFAEKRIVDGFGILEQVHPQVSNMTINDFLGFSETNDPLLKELLDLFNLDHSFRDRMGEVLELATWSASQQGILFLIAALNKGESLVLLDEPKLKGDELIRKILKAREIIARAKCLPSLPTMIITLGPESILLANIPELARESPIHCIRL